MSQTLRPTQIATLHQTAPSLFLCILCLFPSCGDPSTPTPGPTEIPDSVPTELNIPDTDVFADMEDTEVTPPIDWGECEDPTANKGQPGCPCIDNADCESGWCVYGTEDTMICSDTCIDACPEGWTCSSVNTVEGGDAVICLPLLMDLCKPCANADDCGFSDAECVDYGEQGRYCGVSCVDDATCPAGYECNQGQCRRTRGECECSQKAIDENATTTCTIANEHGACTGERQCNPGGLTSCYAQTPTAEACDGLDNDCDGDPDDNLTPLAAHVQQGVCVDSVKMCAGTDGWIEPDYAAIMGYEAVETSCDGLDNDCDGMVDHLLSAPAADKTEGVCVGALQVCDGDKGWAAPDYTTIPGYEVKEASCDGGDNDCDGTVDEGLTPPFASLKKGVCKGVLKLCNGESGWEDPNFSGLPNYEAVEVTIDGLDNDCDGDTDEN
jgi:hypothetical protein